MHEKAVRTTQWGNSTKLLDSKAASALQDLMKKNPNLFGNESRIISMNFLSIKLKQATIKENKCLDSDAGLAPLDLTKASSRKLFYASCEGNGKTPWFW